MKLIYIFILLSCIGNAFATPADWCIRREVGSYKDADLQYPEGVKSVTVPDKRGLDRTVEFDTDGLLTSEVFHTGQYTKITRDRLGRHIQESVFTPGELSKHEASIGIKEESNGYWWIEFSYNMNNDINSVTKHIVQNEDNGNGWKSVTIFLKSIFLPQGAVHLERYDKQCRLLEFKRTDEPLFRFGGPLLRQDESRGELATTSVYRYTAMPDGDNYVVEDIQKGVTSSKQTYKKRLLVKEENFITKEVYIYKYKVDDRGNWIEKNGMKRKILYY